MKDWKNYFYIGGLKWENKINRSPRVYFPLVTLYYRSMVVFIKKMTLFLLTLVARRILSMFS
jgi:hypothetical protein